MDEDFLYAHNSKLVTDNKPFLFDVNPKHPELKNIYLRTAFMILLLLPFFILALYPQRKSLKGILPYICVVTLTGLGYLLIEVVLMQRFEIFLGSPVVAFSSALGSILVFSGLGSLFSGKVSTKTLYICLGAIIVILALYGWLIPILFVKAVSLAFFIKVLLQLLY